LKNRRFWKVLQGFHDNFTHRSYFSSTIAINEGRHAGEGTLRALGEDNTRELLRLVARLKEITFQTSERED